MKRVLGCLLAFVLIFMGIPAIHSLAEDYGVWSVNPAPIQYGTVQHGYDPAALRQTITIANISGGPFFAPVACQITDIYHSPNSDFAIIGLSTLPPLGRDESKTIVIQPAAGLATGVYHRKLLLSCINPISNSATDIYINVTDPPYTKSMLVGESVSWTPLTPGGIWSYDSNYLSLTMNGDTAIFTALALGNTTATYSVNNESYTSNIAIVSLVPQAGDSNNPLPFALLALCSLAGLGGVWLFTKKRRI